MVARREEKGVGAASYLKKPKLVIKRKKEKEKGASFLSPLEENGLPYNGNKPIKLLPAHFSPLQQPIPFVSRPQGSMREANPGTHRISMLGDETNKMVSFIN